jgi:von Willebrand factor type A domain
VRGTTLARHGATRLGDLRQLAQPARRTTLVRITLALALAATLGGAVLLARSAGSGRAAVLPAGAKAGVIVLDVSASVAGPPFERVGAVMQSLVSANQAMGLVMVSDVAYELLPPNSPPSALEQFVRFFVPQRVTDRAPIFGESPWSQFSGGTRIASGLAAALDALRRAHVTHGSVILMSDLNDSQSDRDALSGEALALRRAHVSVRIVPINASPQDVGVFAGLFGPHALVAPDAFKRPSKLRAQPITASSPWALLAVGFVLVGLLAANERLNSRLVPESVA